MESMEGSPDNVEKLLSGLRFDVERISERRDNYFIKAKK
jgi:hypothetical protein